MDNTEILMNTGGLLILILAVYGQIGLFFCFFIPSGGFMFGAGLMIAAGTFDYGLSLVCLILSLAAVAGNLTGYWIGKRTGPYLYNRKDTRFMKRRYLEIGEDFYRKYGSLALTIGVFIPIVRTFSPIVAGIIKMPFQRFLFLSALGSVSYVLCFTLIGYAIGMVPAVRPYLNIAVPIVILLVTVPTVIRVIREFKAPPAK